MFEACGYGGTVGWLGMAFSIVTHLAFAAILILTAIWLFKTVFRKNDEGSTKQ